MSNDIVLKNVTQSNIKTIITDDTSAETLVTCAKTIGKHLVNSRLTTNQIRAIFGEVRRIEGNWNINSQRASRNLILLKPKMAYRAKKERGQGVQDLVKVLDPAIDHVGEDQDNFQRFVDFFEAILAYHKFHGGRET